MVTTANYPWAEFFKGVFAIVVVILIFLITKNGDMSIATAGQLLLKTTGLLLDFVYLAFTFSERLIRNHFLSPLLVLIVTWFLFPDIVDDLLFLIRIGFRRYQSLLFWEGKIFHTNRCRVLERIQFFFFFFFLVSCDYIKNRKTLSLKKHYFKFRGRWEREWFRFSVCCNVNFETNPRRLFLSDDNKIFMFSWSLDSSYLFSMACLQRQYLIHDILNVKSNNKKFQAFCIFFLIVLVQGCSILYLTN